MAGVSKDPFSRFTEMIDIQPEEDGCWLWKGKLSTNGYGKFNAGYDPVTRKYPIKWAHRWSYEYYLGPIPSGYDVDHECEVHHCVNPDHLFAREAREHRSEAAKKMWRSKK